MLVVLVGTTGVVNVGPRTVLVLRPVGVAVPPPSVVVDGVVRLLVVLEASSVDDVVADIPSVVDTVSVILPVDDVG